MIHVSTYDIVLYNKKYIFDLHPVFGTELLKPLQFPVIIAIKVYFVMIMR